MTISIVYYEDWAELLVDGNLIYEGHCIPNRVILELTGVKFSTRDATEEEEKEKCGN